MKKLTLILAFVFMSILVQAQQKEYLIVFSENSRITYIMNGEPIVIEHKIKEKEMELTSLINRLSKSGWAVKTIGGANYAASSPIFQYVFERDKP